MGLFFGRVLSQLRRHGKVCFLVAATAGTAASLSQQQQQPLISSSASSQQQQRHPSSLLVKGGALEKGAESLLLGGFGSLREWLRQPVGSPEAEILIAALEADGWICTDSAVEAYGGDNVCFGTLGQRTNALKLFRTYAKPDGTEVVALATFSDNGVSGHPKVVHGGLLSMICDQTFGFANGAHVLAAASKTLVEDSFISGKRSTQLFGLTAYLHVDYRKPVLAGSTVKLTCKCDRVEDRKRFFVGKMTDIRTGDLLCEAHALFIMPRPPKSTFRRLLSLFTFGQPKKIAGSPGTTN